LLVEFPVSVPLTRFVFHTMPLDDPDAAQAVRVSVQDSANGFRLIGQEVLRSADDALGVRRTSGSVWRFEFRTSPGKSIIVRGIEYFSGHDELFPPLVPFEPSGETH